MENRSDVQLIADYHAGSEQALALLIQRHLNHIYAFVYRYAQNTEEAHDITQETFVKMWRHLKTFDTEKSFTAWLFAIAKNTAFDFYRKKKTIPFSALETDEHENVAAEMLRDPSPLPDELSMRAEDARILVSAMKTLVPKYRVALALYYNNHLNFREIAVLLNEPINTVKSRHRRALSMLKKLLMH